MIEIIVHKWRLIKGGEKKLQYHWKMFTQM